MSHTFEEILTRIPADPNETAPEAAMPPRAWETLLRDAVQGLLPPYTETLQTAHPRAWAIGAPQALPPPCHQNTRKGKGKGKARGKRAGKGTR